MTLYSPNDFLWKVNAEIRFTPEGWAEARRLFDRAIGKAVEPRPRVELPPRTDDERRYAAAAMGRMNADSVAAAERGEKSLCISFGGGYAHGVPHDFMASDIYCRNCYQFDPAVLTAEQQFYSEQETTE